ncbi:diguanylate cyclase [Bacillus sp. FJAT-42315]|uniref:diguanylate cyclase n=1 Tax=Bacillus sp. FJAT-42315 TaxID=2014077 RepID=UPI000C238BB1|nr:diguanylate cyclase [Bacillus sp. FJAT-42315]
MGSTIIPIKVSIGISRYPFDGSKVETLMKKADKAMYRIKHKGKNGYQIFMN